MARWKFRDFNELPHALQLRLNRSYPKSNRYINQFPQRKLGIVAKFISFVAGAVALSLTFFSIFDDDFLLSFHITPGRSVIWYLGIFGMIWTAARSFVPDPHLVFDPDMLLMDVVDETHYLPAEWKLHGLHSDLVRREFSALFEYRVVLFLQELLSVVFAPFILWFSLPKSAFRMVDFFREFTVHVDGVGWLCSFAVFDFQNFNAMRGIRPNVASKLPQNAMAATEDKLASSMVTFKKNFPEWEPMNPTNSIHLQELIERDALLEQERQWRRMRLAGVQTGEVDMQRSAYSTAMAHSEGSTHSFMTKQPQPQPSLAGLDLATKRQSASSSVRGPTVLEGGSIPYVPYGLFSQTQGTSPMMQSARMHGYNGRVQDAVFLSDSHYVPPPMPVDEEEMVAAAPLTMRPHSQSQPTPPRSKSGSMESFPLRQEPRHFNGPAFLDKGKQPANS